jgi:aconitate hydratase
VSLRILLESVLRHLDGRRIRDEDVQEIAHWQPRAARTAEVPFVVGRVLLQDFTGVPLLVDLAAMRSAVARRGGDVARVQPLVPVDLVIDHSVQVDYFGENDALRLNMEMEFHRNAERYQFLKWGTGAFDGLRIVPPGFGICHQVNLEFLAAGVLAKDGVLYPDTLVGTDSSRIRWLTGSREILATPFLSSSGSEWYVADPPVGRSKRWRTSIMTPSLEGI